MKIKKVIFSIIGFIVLLIVVAIIGLILFLDSIVTKGVTTFGTEATGTKVELAGTSISLLSANVQLKGLKIANPKGYQEPEAFGFDKFYVDVDLGTVTSDKIVIEKIEIKGVRIDFEPKVDGGSNLEDIKNNIMKYVGAEEQAAKADKTEEKTTPETNKPATQETEKSSKKVVIKKLLITDAKVTVASKLLGQSVTLPLADIEMEDIGESKETNYGEVLADVYQELMKAIAKAVSGAGLDNINVTGLTDLQDTVKDVGKDIKSGFDKLKKSIFE